MNLTTSQIITATGAVAMIGVGVATTIMGGDLITSWLVAAAIAAGTIGAVEWHERRWRRRLMK